MFDKASTVLVSTHLIAHATDMVSDIDHAQGCSFEIFSFSCVWNFLRISYSGCSTMIEVNDESPQDVLFLACLLGKKCDVGDGNCQGCANYRP